MTFSPSHISKSQDKAKAYERRLKNILVECKGLESEHYDKKRKEYHDTIQERTALISTLPFPTTVNVELINKCNYKCEMCYTVNHDGPAKILSFEAFKKIVDECNEKGLLTLFIANGSEPLIFPDFKKYLTYACERIPDVGIFTNAVKLDRNMSNFILDSGVTRINISLDAATSDTYSAVRGGNLEFVESNIQYILSNRDKNRGPLIRVSFCVQDLNKHEIDIFRAKWEPIVDSVEFQSLHKFENLSELPSGDFLFDEQTKNNYSNFCFSPFSYLAIWSDGTVSPCCTFHGQKLTLGNINDSNTSLSGIWEGKYMEGLRSQFRNKNINSVCEDCLSCTVANP